MERGVNFMIKIKGFKKILLAVGLVICLAASSINLQVFAEEMKTYEPTDEEWEEAKKKAKLSNPDLTEEEMESMKSSWIADKSEEIYGRQIKTLDGERYLYFNDKPEKYTWFENYDDGSKSSEWYNYHSRWVHSDENGLLYTNTWKKIDGNWYHFDEEGFMNINWLKDGDKWYLLDLETGEMKSGGWISGYDHLWYYLDESGAMVTGWVYDNGYWYYLDEDTGAAVWGSWIKYKSKWYLMDANYRMHTGWVEFSSGEYSGKSYYFGTDGAMVTGKQKINGKWYEFADSGELIK